MNTTESKREEEEGSNTNTQQAQEGKERAAAPDHTNGQTSRSAPAPTVPKIDAHPEPYHKTNKDPEGYDAIPEADGKVSPQVVREADELG
jgi:hypothetical protein